MIFAWAILRMYAKSIGLRTFISPKVRYSAGVQNSQRVAGLVVAGSQN